MDSQQLRALVAVAETRSFSRAADRLHVTQPAVSKRVANLEAELGQRLFDRVGHRVYLTAAGQTLLGHARRLLAGLEDARVAVENLGGRVAGSLRLATSHHIGLRRLPAVLKAYAQRYPDVSLEFDFLDSELAYAEVEQGLRELAVITLPDELPGAVTATPLWRERLIPCARKDHPVHGRRPIALPELVRHRTVLLGGHTFTQRTVDRAFAAQHAVLANSTSSSYLEAIAMLVRAGQGWALLPEIMVRDELVAIATRPVIRVERRLGVVRHRDRTPSNAGLAMVELLKAEAAGEIS